MRGLGDSHFGPFNSSQSGKFSRPDTPRSARSRSGTPRPTRSRSDMPSPSRPHTARESGDGRSSTGQFPTPPITVISSLTSRTTGDAVTPQIEALRLPPAVDLLGKGVTEAWGSPRPGSVASSVSVSPSPSETWGSRFGPVRVPRLNLSDVRSPSPEVSSPSAFIAAPSPPKGERTSSLFGAPSPRVPFRKGSSPLKEDSKAPDLSSVPVRAPSSQSGGVVSAQRPSSRGRSVSVSHRTATGSGGLSAQTSSPISGLRSSSGVPRVFDAVRDNTPSYGFEVELSVKASRPGSKLNLCRLVSNTGKPYYAKGNDSYTDWDGKPLFKNDYIEIHMETGGRLEIVQSAKSTQNAEGKRIAIDMMRAFADLLPQVFNDGAPKLLLKEVVSRVCARHPLLASLPLVPHEELDEFYLPVMTGGTVKLAPQLTSSIPLDAVGKLFGDERFGGVTSDGALSPWMVEVFSKRYAAEIVTAMRPDASHKLDKLQSFVMLLIQPVLTYKRSSEIVAAEARGDYMKNNFRFLLKSNLAALYRSGLSDRDRLLIASFHRNGQSGVDALLDSIVSCLDNPLKGKCGTLYSTELAFLKSAMPLSMRPVPDTFLNSIYASFASDAFNISADQSGAIVSVLRSCGVLSSSSSLGLRQEDCLFITRPLIQSDADLIRRTLRLTGIDDSNQEVFLAFLNQRCCELCSDAARAVLIGDYCDSISQKGYEDGRKSGPLMEATLEYRHVLGHGLSTPEKFVAEHERIGGFLEGIIDASRSATQRRRDVRLDQP